MRVYTGFMGPEDYNRLPVSLAVCRLAATALLLQQHCTGTRISYMYVFYWSPDADGPGVGACVPV